MGNISVHCANKSNTRVSEITTSPLTSQLYFKDSWEVSAIIGQRLTSHSQFLPYSHCLESLCVGTCWLWCQYCWGAAVEFSQNGSSGNGSSLSTDSLSSCRSLCYFLHKSLPHHLGHALSKDTCIILLPSFCLQVTGGHVFIELIHNY